MAAVIKGDILFILHDEHGDTMQVLASVAGGFLNLSPEGYGNQVTLEFADGELRLLTNLDPDDDEPVVTALTPMPEDED